MTRQAHFACIRRIARRAVTAGVSPAAAASDETELHFIRSHSGAIWDAMATVRAGKKEPPEREEGAEDPDDYEKCSECDGTGEVDGKTCAECGGTGLVPVDDPEDEVDEDYEVELDGMRINVDYRDD